MKFLTAMLGLALAGPATAAPLPRPYVVSHYDVHLAPDLANKRMTGDVGIQFTSSVERLDAVELDVGDMQIASVKEGQSALYFERKDKTLIVAMRTPVFKNDRRTITIHYTAIPAKGLVFFSFPVESVSDGHVKERKGLARECVLRGSEPDRGGTTDLAIGVVHERNLSARDPRRKPTRHRAAPLSEEIPIQPAGDFSPAVHDSHGDVRLAGHGSSFLGFSLERDFKVAAVVEQADAVGKDLLHLYPFDERPFGR